VCSSDLLLCCLYIISLKPSGYYIYHRVLHSKTLHSANRIQFHVSYDSHKTVFPCIQCVCVQRVYCAVRTGSVHTVLIKFSVQRIQTHSDKCYLHKTLTITKCTTQSVILYQFRTRSRLYRIGSFKTND
jgi:hypothetical protein